LLAHVSQATIYVDAVFSPKIGLRQERPPKDTPGGQVLRGSCPTLPPDDRFFAMLQSNPLQPPRPFLPPPRAVQRTSVVEGRFVSAEDFDATGVLTGVDPCESRYWWMPELYWVPELCGPEAAAGATGGQALCRIDSRTTAAA